MNNLNPILAATNITSPAVTKINIRAENIFRFKRLPICPPIKTAKKRNQKLDDLVQMVSEITANQNKRRG